MISTVNHDAPAQEPDSPPWLVLTGRLVGIGVFALILLWPGSGPPDTKQRLAAIVALMAVYWVTQALPIAVTSLIPLVAFPLLGIQTARDVSKSYINENIFLYMGGFIIAMGIERWNLHRRIALHVVRVIGTSPRRLLFGFMLATAFLSMWISNTASTLLMMPIGLAMLTALAAAEDSDQESDAIRQIGMVLMMGIAWSASIGGLSTLVGTPTNLSFAGIWTETFPDAPEISAGQWIAVAIAPATVMLLAAWGMLASRIPASSSAHDPGPGFVESRLRDLGPPTSAELKMLVIFTATALLWIFRRPLQFGSEPLIGGWASIIEAQLLQLGVESTIAEKAVHDSTVAMLMVILMFVIPARRKNGRTEYLMDWPTAERLPWGILLLIGGGFAIAGAFGSSGLATWVGQSVADSAAAWPPWMIVAGVCLVLTFLTELTSNVATVNTLMPVLAAACGPLGIDPRMVMIPGTLSTSCAFMLPIATPPNAIVFASGRIPMRRMVQYGILLNLLGVAVMTVSAFLLLQPLMGIQLDQLPEFVPTP